MLIFGSLFALIAGHGGYSIMQAMHGWIPACRRRCRSSSCRWHPRPSIGCRVADQIEGFRHYLGEEDRLNALNPPERTTELVGRCLPFAIALDAENACAKRFAGVLACDGLRRNRQRLV